MNVLLIGGTGLISTGIVKHLLKRNVNLTLYNRGKRESTLPQGIETIQGDRGEIGKGLQHLSSLQSYNRPVGTQE